MRQDGINAQPPQREPLFVVLGRVWPGFLSVRTGPSEDLVEIDLTAKDLLEWPWWEVEGLWKRLGGLRDRIGRLYRLHRLPAVNGELFVNECTLEGVMEAVREDMMLEMMAGRKSWFSRRL